MVTIMHVFGGIAQIVTWKYFSKGLVSFDVEHLSMIFNFVLTYPRQMAEVFQC